jgi:hypothetical protein
MKTLNSHFFHIMSFTLLLTTALTSPVFAQWGVMSPDSSIRQRGLLIDGPNPGRVLREQMLLPMQRPSIDLNSGTIYKGGLIDSAPSQLRLMQICMQTGVC